MKKLMFNLKVSRVLFIIAMIANFFAPVYPGKIVNLNVFQIAIMIVWIYGYLCHLGYFKKQVSVSEDGVIRYEVNVPITQLGLIRITQVGYSLLLRVNLDWRFLIGLIVFDVIYVMFIIFDKNSYYYESELN